MRFYGEEIVAKVRERRKQNISLRKLEEEFGVPNTTISRWVRDIYSDEPNFLKAREKELEYKSRFWHGVRRLRVDKSGARIFASLLYWCEGSKYPASNQLAFSNSDAAMVKSFLELLRKGFAIDESKLRIHLQLHTTHDVKEVTKLWSNLLNVEKKKFYKPTLTKPTKNMKRRNYVGTCTIKYFDVKLLLQLTGIFEEFSRKFGEVSEWSNEHLC